MSVPAPTADPCLQMLDRLLEIGMDLADDLHAETRSAEPDTLTTAQAIPLYDQLSRAIRRNILLVQRVREQPGRTPDRRVVARKRILREVEDHIDRHARPTDRPVLQAELEERLETLDLDEEIDTRPIPDIIADICRDLGLANRDGIRPYRRRTPEALAALHARATEATQIAARSLQNPLPLAGEGRVRVAPAVTWRDTG